MNDRNKLVPMVSLLHVELNNLLFSSKGLLLDLLIFYYSFKKNVLKYCECFWPLGCCSIGYSTGLHDQLRRSKCFLIAIFTFFLN